MKSTSKASSAFPRNNNSAPTDRDCPGSLVSQSHTAEAQSSTEVSSLCLPPCALCLCVTSSENEWNAKKFRESASKSAEKPMPTPYSSITSIVSPVEVITSTRQRGIDCRNRRPYCLVRMRESRIVTIPLSSFDRINRPTP